MTNSVKKGTIYITISSIVFIISGYLINVWLGRYLGPIDYGRYGVITALMSIINIIITSGLTQATSKFISEKPKDTDKILKSSLYLQFFITLGLTALSFFLSFPLSIIFNDKDMVFFIQLSALTFPLYAFYAVYIDYYNGRHNFRKQAIMSILYSLFKLILIILLAYFYGLVGTFIGLIIAPLISLIYGFEFPDLRVEFFSFKKILSFSSLLIGYSICFILLQSMDIYFIKALVNNNYAPGFYTANQNIAKIPIFLFISLATVAYPSISKNISSNLIKESRQLIFMMMRFILIMLVPSVLLVSLTSRQLIELLFTKAYLPAAPSLSVLIFGSGFITIFTLLAHIINGAGKPKTSFVTAVVGILIIGVFCYLLVPKYELLGAALATSIGSFISMVIAAIFVYRRFETLVSLRTVSKIIIAALLSCSFVGFMEFPLIFLPFVYIILFLLYLFILILLKELTRKDLEQVKGLVPFNVHLKN
jgi:stage V sporulation protein B